MENTIQNASLYHKNCKAIGFAKIMVDYANKILLSRKKKTLSLPDFLYEDDGEIKVGVYGDAVVTDKWNEWLKENKLK